MRHSIALCALAILLLVTSNFSAAQRCEETPTGQIKNVLDRSANRVLQREIVGSYGEEGKHILIQIAGDNAQPLNRREGAIRLLGEYRSPEAEELLKGMLSDPKTICKAIWALQEYRDSELISRFLGLLDDQRSCGKLGSFWIGSGKREEGPEFNVSDEAVGALERITGKRFEKESDHVVIGHSSTQVWKAWWDENRVAFTADPDRFLKPQVATESDSGHFPCSVETIAVSPDGKVAFSAGKSYDPWVREWKIENRQQIWAAPNAAQEEAQSSAFSPNGREIAMGTANGAVKILDAATGNRIRTLIATTGVEAVAFDHSGAKLAVAQDDGVTRLFDTNTWCEIEQFDNVDVTTGIAFSPDDTLIAAATFEQVRLWNVASGTAIREFKVRPARPPRVFADLGERRAELWRMAWKVAFGPDGKRLAAGSSAAIQLWNPATGEEIFKSPSGGQVGSLHFSPDGHWVIWGNHSDEIVRWNPETAKRQRIKNEFSLGDTAITPDGKLILSPGSGEEIGIYDLNTRRKVGVLACKKQN